MYGANGLFYKKILDKNKIYMVLFEIDGVCAFLKDKACKYASKDVNIPSFCV